MPRKSPKIDGEAIGPGGRCKIAGTLTTARYTCRRRRRYGGRLRRWRTADATTRPPDIGGGKNGLIVQLQHGAASPDEIAAVVATAEAGALAYASALRDARSELEARQEEARQKQLAAEYWFSFQKKLRQMPLEFSPYWIWFETVGSGSSMRFDECISIQTHKLGTKYSCNLFSCRAAHPTNVQDHQRCWVSQQLRLVQGHQQCWVRS